MCINQIHTRLIIEFGIKYHFLESVYCNLISDFFVENQ